MTEKVTEAHKQRFCPRSPGCPGTPTPRDARTVRTFILTTASRVQSKDSHRNSMKKQSYRKTYAEIQMYDVGQRLPCTPHLSGAVIKEAARPGFRQSSTNTAIALHWDHTTFMPLPIHLLSFHNPGTKISTGNVLPAASGCSSSYSWFQGSWEATGRFLWSVCRQRSSPLCLPCPWVP